MNFLDTFAAALPKEINLEDLRILVPAERWHDDPELAAVQSLARSGKFDDKAYMEKYPDVRESGIDAVEHYVRFGIEEKREYPLLMPSKYEKKKNDKPKVSVIIPVYNNAQYLHECIDSVINQTLKEIEIIIVNDGSTDPKAVEILNDYAKKDKRIKLIHKKNTGYGHSMNVGLDAATGEYIGIVESDDYIENNMYEELYEAVRKFNTVSVKSNPKQFINDGSKYIFRNNNIFSDDKYYNKVLNPLYDKVIFNENILNQTGIYLKEFLKKYNIKFNETPNAAFQDNGFYFQVMMHCKEIVFINKEYYNHRCDNVYSSINSSEKTICCCEEYAFIRKIIENNSLLKKNFLYDYTFRKFLSYKFNLNRLKEKNREKLYKFFRKEFVDIFKNKEIDIERFKSEDKFFLKKLVGADVFSLVCKKGSTLKKRKILLYNWASIYSNSGGGVGIYIKNIIPELSKKYDVFVLNSGTKYTSNGKAYYEYVDGAYSKYCNVYEFINSPVTSPAFQMFNNLDIVIGSKTLYELFIKFNNEVGPFDIIHFHNIEGLSINILNTKKIFYNTLFYYTFHNYNTICPQVNLWKHEMENCINNHNFCDCFKCVTYENRENFIRSFGISPNIIDVSLNINLKGKNFYKEYKKNMLDSINKNIDLCIMPSCTTRNIFVEHGLSTQKNKVIYIGTKFSDCFSGPKEINLKKDILHIAYIGYMRRDKGYFELMSFFEQMDDSLSNKISITIAARSEDAKEKERVFALKNKFFNVEYHNGYTHENLGNILKDIELGIIPVVWEDVLPQVAWEFVSYGIPILSSDLGGAKEISNCNDNFIFKNRNYIDFFNKLRKFVTNKNELKKFWGSFKRPIKISEHINELESIYNF